MLTARRLPVAMFREFLPLFGIFMAVLLVMVTIDHFSILISYYITYKANLGLVFENYISRFPYFISYTMPPALAIAILIGLGRMAKDSELKAAYSAGVPPLRLVWPVVGVGLVVTLLGFYNTNFLQPNADANFIDSYYRITGKPGTPKTQQLKSYRSPDGQLLYHVGALTPREKDPDFADLAGVMVITNDGTYTAPTGVWDSRSKSWELNSVSFTPWRAISDDGGELPDVGSKPELRRSFPFEFVALESDARPPEHLPYPELVARSQNQNLTIQERYDAAFKLQRRFHDPAAALVFSLVAVAVGLTVRNRAWAFASVIMIIAGYWVLWTLGKNLAESQAVLPWLAAWLPAIVFGTGGVLGLRRLA